MESNLDESGTKDFSSETGTEAGLIRHLFENFRAGRDVDLSMNRRIVDLLGIVGGVGFVFRDVSENLVEYSVFVNDLWKDSFHSSIGAKGFSDLDEIIKKISETNHGMIWTGRLTDEYGVLIFISDIKSIDEWGADRGTKLEYISILIPNEKILITNRFLRWKINGKLIENSAPGLLATFYAITMTFRFREQILSYFPREFRMAAWCYATNEPGGIAPPWSGEGGKLSESALQGRRTISLSLDLRKSTFLMKEAKDRKFHADWLEALVDILRLIAHSNLAIFDKFTGDGVIAHFLVDEIATVLSRWPRTDTAELHACKGDPLAAITRLKRENILISSYLALRCAREMILAVNRHLSHAEPNVRFLTALFGASIGIAEDEAIWSMDRNGRPIVVGPGVVNACRLNGGKAGEIHFPNDFAQVLRYWNSDLKLERVDMSNKDYAPDQMVKNWVIAELPTGIARPEQEITKLVDEVWERYLTAKPLRGDYASG